MKTLAVLFPDEWIAYSPTVIQLTKVLREDFDVRVYAIDTGKYDNHALDNSIYHLVHIPGFLAAACKAIGIFGLLRIVALALVSYRFARHSAHVIGVDWGGAFAAMLLRRPFHYLSLELYDSRLLRAMVRVMARTVITQNAERLRHQLMAEDLAGKPVFFLPNSPMGPSLVTSTRRPPVQPVKLLYMGNAVPAHGLCAMIRLAEALAGRATLTIKGIISPAMAKRLRGSCSTLVDTGRLCLDDSYLDQVGLPGFVAQFDIGLCLYDIDVIGPRNINYLTAPSGKMHQYFNAGLPVLGTRISGLDPVREFRAGILVDSLDTATLSSAVEKIVHEYECFSAGAIQAAHHYAFDGPANLLRFHLKGERALPLQAMT
jgi:hypothetical protein